MAYTEVILADYVPSLGAEADIVKVKRGYARNFLIPRGKAHELTSSSLRMLNHLKAKRQEREAQELQKATDLAEKLNALKLNFTLKMGESGRAFGSVTNQDIYNALLENIQELPFDRHQIELDKPLKSTGDFEVPIQLHAEVKAKLFVSVKASVVDKKATEEEKGRSASGGSKKKSASRNK